MTDLILGRCYKLSSLCLNETHKLYDLYDHQGNDYGWKIFNPENFFIFLGYPDDNCYEFYSLEFNTKIMVYKAHFINKIKEIF